MSMNEHYCITANNKSAEWLKTHFEACDISYGIGVEEFAPTTGTQHMQTYVQYPSRKRITTVMKHFPKCKIIPCGGSSEENINYCRKTVGVLERPPPTVEVGEPRFIEKKHKGQGKRTDLKMWTDKIMSGEIKVRDIMIEQPMLYHQYGRLFRDIEDLYQERARRPLVMPECLWIYGPTGTGKTHKAHEMADDDTFFWSYDNGWWDNYNGEKTIIINEFRGNIRFSLLLEICDKFLCKLSRRGRAPVSCLANRVIVTSSLSPQECYNNLSGEDKIDQLLRRFKVVKLSVPYVTQENN